MKTAIVQVMLKGCLVQSVPFEGDCLRIGRLKENDIVLGNLSVSRVHALLRRENGRMVLEDVGSENGCFVNGARIRRRVVVTPGDEIRIGKHVLLLRDDDDGAAHAAAPDAADRSAGRSDAWDAAQTYFVDAAPIAPAPIPTTHADDRTLPPEEEALLLTEEDEGEDGADLEAQAAEDIALDEDFLDGLAGEGLEGPAADDVLGSELDGEDLEDALVDEGLHGPLAAEALEEALVEAAPAAAANPRRTSVSVPESDGPSSLGGNGAAPETAEDPSDALFALADDQDVAASAREFDVDPGADLDEEGPGEAAEAFARAEEEAESEEAPVPLPRPATPAESALPADEPVDAASHAGLIVQRNGRLDRVLSWDRDRLCIGRSAECEVMLDAPGVSRRHALLVRDGETFEVRDLESINGTRVNGERVTRRRLDVDDVIEVEDFRLTFVIDRSPIGSEIQAEVPGARAEDEGEGPLEMTLVGAALADAPAVTQPGLIVGDETEVLGAGREQRPAGLSLGELDEKELAPASAPMARQPTTAADAELPASSLAPLTLEIRIRPESLPEPWRRLLEDVEEGVRLSAELIVRPARD